MAGASKNQDTLPRKLVNTQILSLLLLFMPGSLSWQSTALPPPPPPARHHLTVLTVGTNSTMGAAAAASLGCASPGGLSVSPGPTSQVGTVGDRLELECRYWVTRGNDANVRVTWYHVCPHLPSHGSSCGGAEVEVVQEKDGTRWHMWREKGRVTLVFLALSHEDAGLYFCRVESDSNGDMAQSCGTFVQVHEVLAVPLLSVKQSTKNRVLVAQGMLLFLGTAGPGLVLLFRKRWANERKQQSKKNVCEEENLYEGLNIDECSMYEDISKGGQPTYQDVGNPPVADLEKP